MSQAQFSHTPVMLNEVLEFFEMCDDGVVIDATFGLGGHSKAIMEFNPKLTILGIDRDQFAVNYAHDNYESFIRTGRLKVVRGVFNELSEIAASAFPQTPIVGCLFDLGVSSPQLDMPERGFSYSRDGSLDMRMDSDLKVTADDIVNGTTVEELISILKTGGETRHTKRIAEAIVSARPINGTVRLAEVVASSLPAFSRRNSRHPARRTFQAIRIAVNNEMEVLESALEQSIDLVTAGGIIVTIAYHSGEDRLVKKVMNSAVTGGCVCSPKLGCVCGATPTGTMLTRGSMSPTELEMQLNRRSTSARLRAFQKNGNSKFSEEQLSER